MNFQDIIKPLSLTPAVQTDDSPFNKGYTRVAGGVNRLATYIQVPFNLTNDTGYRRRLLFQFNYTFDSDFYLTNIKQLLNFGALLVTGGCLCIKWRAGTKLVDGIQVPDVLRYKLFDSAVDTTWSDFILYTNQKVKKNFCLEFWTDATEPTNGITQSFYLKTDRLAIPNAIDDADFVFLIDTPVLTLADLTQPIPLVFPIDWSNEAYLDNI